MTETKRIAYWDNVKFFLILFVVIGHFIDSLTGSGAVYNGIYIFIYSFHMPMFLFVSGLFTKYDDRHGLRIDKIVFYFLLGYLFKALIHLVLYLAGTEPTWSWLRTNIAPWYLFVLGGYLLLTYCIKKINPYAVFAVSIIVSLIAGYFDFIDDFLTISKFIVFFPFFYLGYCLKPDTVIDFINKKPVKIFGIAVIILFALSCLFLTHYVYAMRPVYAAWHSYYEFPISSKLGIPIRVFQYISSFAIMLGIAVIIPKKKLGYISDIGKRTLQIYILHYFIIKPIGLLGLGVKLIDSLDAFGAIIWILAAVLLTFVLSLPIFEIPFVWLQKSITKILPDKIKKG